MVEAVKLCDFGLCAIAPPVTDVRADYAERMSKLNLSPTPSSHASGPRETSPNTVLETGAAPAAPVERKWTLSDFSGSPGFVAPEVRRASLSPPLFGARLCCQPRLRAVFAHVVIPSPLARLPARRRRHLRAPIPFRQVVMHDSYNGRFIDAWSVGCVMLELVVGHDTFDHLWMKAYTHQAMCDQASFGARVMGTVKQLRQLPDFALAATL